MLSEIHSTPELKPSPVSAQQQPAKDADGDKILWFRFAPYFALHAACLFILWVGVSPVAVGVAVFLYVARMFFVTALYHRYFSHRAFKTSRFTQFVFGFLACTTAQRGPLWWAAHHREHHAESDTIDDVHSPMHMGFWVSHMGWFMQKKNQAVKEHLIKDLMKFPELVLLEKFAYVPFLIMGACLYGVGHLLSQVAPEWGTNGGQLLVWGFVVSTVAVYHGTYTINSLCHVWGSRRWDTKDDSRNNFILALITLGEGWHNNHHKFPGLARQGFRYWEIDITYYILKVLSWFHIVWDLRPTPKHLKA